MGVSFRPSCSGTNGFGPNPETGLETRPLCAAIVIASAVVGNVTAEDLPASSPRPSSAPLPPSAAAENAGDPSSSDEEIPPRLLEELVGVAPGNGGVTTRTGADALCVVSGRHVYGGEYAREKEGGGGGGNTVVRRRQNSRQRKGDNVDRKMQKDRQTIRQELINRHADRQMSRQTRQLQYLCRESVLQDEEKREQALTPAPTTANLQTHLRAPNMEDKRYTMRCFRIGEATSHKPQHGRHTMNVSLGYVGCEPATVTSRYVEVAPSVAAVGVECSRETAFTEEDAVCTLLLTVPQGNRSWTHERSRY